jgi:hypothetical protein
MIGVECGQVGWKQLYCAVKLPHPSCRRGATPGPDGALDARQGLGLPPGPIGRVEILVSDSDLRRSLPFLGHVPVVT